ncbi:MAG: hypothetical protein P8L83_01735 [Flavobacteriaceae bacterium]|nr:hypothetical protein [Flavobacteriaceae bacterium]
MKPYIASLINAIILISMGAWGYFDSDPRAVTALIPVIIGFILLLVNSGVKNENKLFAHVAVLLTLIILLGLIKPLTGSIEKQNSLAIFRVIIMILSSGWALKTFIKNFIEIRKARK